MNIRIASPVSVLTHLKGKHGCVDKTGPEVINHFPCSTQLSMKF